MDTLRFYDLETLGEPGVPDRPCLRKFVAEMEPETWRLHEGESISPLWPAEARIYMTGEESGIELCDLVGTTRNVVIASQRFRDLIERHCTGVPIEYLAVAIHDHRKRLLGDGYFIVNPLGAHDCADLDRSAVLWKDGPGTEILGLSKVVIDRRRGGDAPQLFRLEHARSTYVLRYDLALAIKEADLPNVVWAKLGVSG